MSSFIFLGGDLRMLYAAEYLNKTHDCFAYGFESAEVFPVPAAGELIPCDYAVLPLPLTSDGVRILMPYHGENPDLDIIPKAVKQGGIVLAGKSCPYLERVCEENGLRLFNYFEREELQVLNAVPTAEGALEIMFRELPVTVFGLNVLITGYGRIGEVMARMLIALGAKVSVYARRKDQLAKAECIGCCPVSEDELVGKLGEVDVIVNTVPAPLFDRRRIMRIKRACLLIDLASKAGVEDMELAASVGVKVIRALSLPGKTAPISAGHIIGKTIENMCG